MKNKLLIIALIAMILILLASEAMASCSVSTDNANLEIRSDRENVYSTSISAENNDKIDIKISFEITEVDGNTCPSSIKANAKIYRWDETNSEWALDRTTSTQSNNLEENPFIFTWNDAITINDNYKRYKVEGFIKEGTEELETMEAYIDVVDNTCSGIELTVNNFTIDEGEEQTKNFRIENNTNKEFDIEVADVLFTTPVLTSGSINYPNTVNRYSEENVEVTLEPKYVSSNTTVTGTFKVSGYLGSTFCSTNDIGRKNFEVTIKNNGSGNGNGTSPNCDDITLHEKNFSIGEGETTKEIFYIKNESTKRFEITDIDTTSNGLDLKDYYFERYAFPGEVSDIVIEAIAPNVTKNKTYENEIKVKGKFSDGKTCNFDDITKKEFDVYITDGSASLSSCDEIIIDVQSSIEVNNYGELPLNITNNSSEKLDVIIESSLSVSPTLISLPSKTTMSTTLTFSIYDEEGTIRIIPVSNCNIGDKTVLVKNKALGALSQVSMKANSEIDENNTKIIIEYDNPTTKNFVGALAIDIEGEVINETIITIPPGKSFGEVIIDKKPVDNVNGTVTFRSNGQEISTTIGENTSENNVFAGFFALGGGIWGIGLLLLVIIIIGIVVIAIVNSVGIDTTKEENQEFVKKW